MLIAFDLRDTYLHPRREQRDAGRKSAERLVAG
jgi:hypothetical protein